MKKQFNIIIICFSLFFSTIVFAQKDSTDYQKISSVLLDYIEGTANGEPDRLRKAFHKDFNLYTVTDKDSLRIRSGEQYILGTKQGEKSNRIGRIISIDIEKDAAMAKAEILIPKWRVFTDYFLLMKYEGSWKIVQKSYTWRNIPSPKNRVLFITSNQDTYGNSKINASNHFSEIVHAYDEFINNGFAVDFISPNGGAIPIGYIETSDSIQKKYLFDNNFMNLLKNTFTPQAINYKNYKSVYFSGGGSAMFGVATNIAIQNIASNIYNDTGIVSAVCHGTAGIAYIKNKDGVSIYKGKNITGFPKFFENVKADYFKTFPFVIDDVINNNGGKFIFSKKERNNYVVVDERIITGQDPSATRTVAQKVIEALKLLQ